MKHLPLHETAVHPHTGQRLRALYIDRHGRARYPIMGASPDDPADPPADPAKTDPPADPPGDPAKTDPPADPPADLGFPKDTPVAQMKPLEQAAYWQHQARKHEDRNKEWQKTLGGKTAAEVAAERQELATLRTEKMSDSEKAVNEAKLTGRREASLALAPQMFAVALSHVDEDRRKVLIENTDLSRVINEDGSIDTDKVKSIAEALAPAGTDGERTPRIRDFGGGDRRTDKTSGVAAGREAYRERRGKKSTTTSNDS